MGRRRNAPVGRVLVVDDEELVRWALKERLQERGYHVRAIDSGRRALEACRTVDLVLVDLELPDIGGLEVARAVRRMRPACPVILMTAHDTPVLERQAAACDVYRVVDKPFDLDEIVRLVGEALRRGRGPAPGPGEALPAGIE